MTSTIRLSILSSAFVVFSLIPGQLHAHPGNRLNTTVEVNGTPYSFNLNGRDGRDGQSGQDGTAGDMCENGDDGRSGGDGQDGENGGNVTAYAANQALVKLIQVQSAAGRGGRGAPGGSGGPGGPSGRRQTCDAFGKCEWHDCSAGSPGHSGGYGDSGDSGLDGNLYLVLAHGDIGPERTYFSVTLGEAVQKPVHLAKHQWQHVESGALRLLGPGSYLADDYFVYQSTAARDVQVEWAADVPMDPYATKSIVLGWDGTRVTAQLSDLGASLEVTEEAALTRIRVTKVIDRVKLRQLDPDHVSLTSQGLGLVFKDRAAVSDLVKTGFMMRIYLDRLFDKELFDNIIPDSAIVSDKDSVTVLIDQLGIDPKDLKGGNGLRFEIQTSRRYGGLIENLGEREFKAKIPK